MTPRTQVPSLAEIKKLAKSRGVCDVNEELAPNGWRISVHFCKCEDKPLMVIVRAKTKGDARRAFVAALRALPPKGGGK